MGSWLLDFLLALLLDILAPLRRALARLLRRLLIAEAAKNPREEVAAAGIIAATAEEALLVGHRQRLAAHRIHRVIDRNVRPLKLGAFEDREQRLVAAVDVFAELQDAGFAHERRL